VSSSRRAWAHRLLLVVLVGALTVALFQQRDAVVVALDDLTGTTLVLSLVCAVLGNLAIAMAWRALLPDVGSGLRLLPALQVFLLGQLGKYVPGSVWPVVVQMELGRRHGLARARVGAASIATLGIGMLSGVVVAAVCLALQDLDAALRYWFLLLLVPPLVVLMHPRVFVPLLDRVLRAAGRQPVGGVLGWRGTAAAAGWSLLSWLLFGLGTWLLAADLGGTRPLLAIGAFAAAWTAGFLVVVVPAGAGVREAGLVLLLAGDIGTGPATLLAVCS
jgi:glycosyltransferase 2 family protein